MVRTNRMQFFALASLLQDLSDSKLDFVRSSGVGEGINEPGVQSGKGFCPVIVRCRR